MNKHLGQSGTCPMATGTGAAVGSQSNLEQFVQKQNEAKIPKLAKQLCLEGCINYVARDMRPMYSVTQPGFIGLAQACITVGAKFGNVKAETVLPSNVTVKNAVMRKVAVVKTGLRRMIDNHYKQGHIIHCTTDGWKSEVGQRDYQGLTCHYIDENFVLHDRTLGSFAIDGQKSAVNIVTTLQEEMKAFSVDLLERSATFVTDQASNMVKAFNLNKQEMQAAKLNMNPQTRVNCMCHVINRALEVMMQELEASDHDLYKSMEALKGVVQYIKRAGLMKELDYMLVQEAPTRWLSRIQMMEGIEKQWDKIVDILTREKKLDLLAPLNYDHNQLKAMIKFLRVFHDAILSLEATKTPTAHLVPAWAAKLLKHCESQVNDFSLLDEPKMILHRVFTEKFVTRNDTIIMSHKIAVFLNPSSRTMGCIPAEERADVVAALKKRMEVFGDDNAAAAAGIGSESGGTENDEPPSKKSLLDEFDDEGPAVIGSFDEEINAYKSMPLKADYKKTGLLNFWKEYQHVFPHIAAVARDALALPASSTPSERLFSAQGNVISNKRNRLNPDTVGALLVLRSNADITPDHAVLNEDEEVEFIEGDEGEEVGEEEEGEGEEEEEDDGEDESQFNMAFGDD